MIRFRTLGALELRRADGSEIRPILQAPKRLALLAYLAVARPTGFQRRDRLLSMLWPDLDESHARATLRQTVRALRIDLGSGVLVNRGDEEIALEDSRIWCDVRAFGLAVEQQDPQLALALYGGPLLDGFRPRGAGVDYEHWLDGERERLQALACVAAREVAEAADRAGDDYTAARAWARLVELAAFDEEAARRLMELYACDGRPTAADAVYKSLVQRLRTQLDVGPQPATVELARRLRRGLLPADASRAESARRDAASSGDHRPAAEPGAGVGASRGRASVLLALALAALIATGWWSRQVHVAATAGLRAAEPATIDPPASRNAEAYTFYLRAMDYRSRPGWTAENADIVERLLERAIELDSSFALAYAQLSMLHGGRYARHDRTDRRMESARVAADAAIRLQPELPEARLALGYYYYRGLRAYDRARAEFERAHRARPGGAFGLASLAWIDRTEGRWADALDKLKTVTVLQPRNENFATALATTYVLTRRYAEAEVAYDRASELSPDAHRARIGKGRLYVTWQGVMDTLRQALAQAPRDDPEAVRERFFLAMMDRDYPQALRELDTVAIDDFDRIPDTHRYHLLRGYAYRATGDIASAAACFEAARAELERAVVDRPVDAALRSALGKAYAGLGRREDALREARRAVGLVPTRLDAMEGVVLATELAAVYTEVGESELAVQLLEDVISGPAWLSGHSLRLDPRWDPLRGHPEFDRLVAAADALPRH